MDPAVSGASPAVTPIDVVPAPRAERAFARGIATGITMCAIAVHIWLAFNLQSMNGLYRDLGGAPLPLVTRISISPLWLWGVPVVSAAALCALLGTRRRTLAPYVALAAVLAVTVVGTWWFSQSPIRELAGNIRSD